MTIFIRNSGGRSWEDLQWMRERALQRARLHRHQHGKLADRLEDLEDCLAEQALLNQALLKLCLEKGLFTRENFAAFLRAVDLLDGEADGRFDRNEAKKLKAAKKTAAAKEAERRPGAPTKRPAKLRRHP